MKKPKLILFTALSLLLGSGLLADTKVLDLGKPGTKTPIGQDLILTYSFNVRPAMGMVILKVKVTDKDGNPAEGLTLTGVSDMPEMRDSNSGKVKFQQNKKKDFLLPINVTMPGKWNVTVIIQKKKKVLLTGGVDFHV